MFLCGLPDLVFISWGLSPRPYAILIIKLKCHRSWYVTHLETIRFSDPVITYAHRRIRNTYILSIAKEHPNIGCSFFFCAFTRRALTPSGSYPHACWGCSHHPDWDRVIRQVVADAFAIRRLASRVSNTFSFPSCSFYLILIFLPLLI